MPTLYFCQPHAKNQGMLRAVLSVNECERVVSQHAATYVGDQFPKLANEQVPANDFAVLNFPPNETPAGWRSGYYRPDSDLTKLNESLLPPSRYLPCRFQEYGRTTGGASFASYFHSPAEANRCRLIAKEWCPSGSQ